MSKQISGNQPHTMMIAGVDVTRLARSAGPYTTLYLNSGSQAKERAHLALDRAGAPDLHRFLDVIDENEDVSSRAIIAAGEGPAVVFTIEEPLRFDVARSGNVLSLGTLIEYSQFSAPHVVATIEDDVFGLTSFGSVAVPDSDWGTVSVSESLLHAVEQLRFIEPRMLALVGAEQQLAKYSTSFSEAFPEVWIQHYPTDGIDADLREISDRIVNDARSRAAELLTHELAQFRAARDLGRAIEGGDVLRAMQQETVEALFVHDDPDDGRLHHNDRLVDHITHLAAAQGTSIRMIPDLAAGNGPAGGLGALPRDTASPAVASTGTPTRERSSQVESSVAS